MVHNHAAYQDFTVANQNQFRAESPKRKLFILSQCKYFLFRARASPHCACKYRFVFPKYRIDSSQTSAAIASRHRFPKSPKFSLHTQFPHMIVLKSKQSPPRWHRYLIYRTSRFPQRRNTHFFPPFFFPYCLTDTVRKSITHSVFTLTLHSESVCFVHQLGIVRDLWYSPG